MLLEVATVVAVLLAARGPLAGLACTTKTVTGAVLLAARASDGGALLARVAHAPVSDADLPRGASDAEAVRVAARDGGRVAARDGGCDGGRDGGRDDAGDTERDEARDDAPEDAGDGVRRVLYCAIVSAADCRAWSSVTVFSKKLSRFLPDVLPLLNTYIS